LTTSNKDEPIIPLYVNGRNCTNPNSTGCPELFENTYYSLDKRMTTYFKNKSIVDIMNNT
jgi:hypothetical protein